MITTKLYNDEVNLVFNEKSHTYKANGNPVDGVTTILKIVAKLDKKGNERLIPWAVRLAGENAKAALLSAGKLSAEKLNEIFEHAAKEYERERDASALRGKLVHSAVENWIKTTNPGDMDNDTIEKYELFCGWAMDNDVKFVHSERPVLSLEHGYCGTLDLVFEMNGKRYIGDIKTSNSVGFEYFLQTAAYQKAYTEETGEKIDGRVIIRVGKEKWYYGIDKENMRNVLEVTEIPSEHYAADLEAFLSAKNVYQRNRWYYENEGKFIVA